MLQFTNTTELFSMFKYRYIRSRMIVLAQGFWILAVSSKLVLLCVTTASCIDKNNYTEHAIIDCSSIHNRHV